MKINFSLLSLLAFLLIVSSCQNSEEQLSDSYVPTKKEWLEISIFKLIKDRTDAWEHRVAFMVGVDEKEGITVTLTSANGQNVLENSAKQLYVGIVKKDIENFIKKYRWAKGLKVFVQYI